MSRHIDRRDALCMVTGLGLGSAVFHRALAQQLVARRAVTSEMVGQAAWISGIELSEDERESVARSLARSLANYQSLREVAVDYSDPPAIHFVPEPWKTTSQPVGRNRAKLVEARAPRPPATDEDLAFLPVSELAPLLKARTITSVDLTRLYLERLRRYNPVLNCVVSWMDDLALSQARRADRELAAGLYRGPLHGVPWGAKDLIAYPGYPTTWGASHLREQRIETKATVAKRLEEAGAVLIAKLSLGALAQGDRWFQGRTNNPWNPAQGSSGSSAGSASAAAAGCVGFALGSETLGSIVSPCRRCGATGLRPTFGRVSRFGCMPLSWTMDKIGPIARGIEDCALVLDAIHGSDGRDATAVDRPLAWPCPRPLEDLRVGYIPTRDDEQTRSDLRVLRDVGVQLVPIELPDKLPARAVSLMLGTEATAVFDEITRQHITAGLNNWPRTFRAGQFTPAVEYLRASRVRTKLQHQMQELMSGIDLYVGGSDLVITNLTGHPTAVLPQGFVDNGRTRQPRSITFTGRLYGESELLKVALAFEKAVNARLERPPLDQFLEKEEPPSPLREESS